MDQQKTKVRTVCPRLPVSLDERIAICSVWAIGDSRSGNCATERTGIARAFIRGSSDGLELMAAKLLIGQGHAVLSHGKQ